MLCKERYTKCMYNRSRTLERTLKIEILDTYL